MSNPEPRAGLRQQLISNLIPQVSCPPGSADCSESDFCTSLRQNSQLFNFQNSNQFCDWFDRSGCGGFAKNLQDFISATPSCKLLSNFPYDPHLEDCRNAITELQKNAGFSVYDQCMGMSPTDLARVATFCAGVDSARGNNPTSSPPASGDDSGINWLGDGAIGTGVATAILYLGRFIRVMREVGQKAKETGESMGFLARGLRTVNKELLSLFKETRKFFGVTVVEGGRLIKFIFTGAWLPKKKAAQQTTQDGKTEQPAAGPAQDATAADNQGSSRDKLRLTSPEIRIPLEDIDPIRGKPNRQVVLKQFEGLKDDSHYQQEGMLFNQQKEYVSLFLAQQAIKVWYKLSPEDHQKFLSSDTLPLRGALPADFIRWFAAKFLREETIEQIHTGAAEWAKDEAREIAQNISPMVEKIRDQIIASGKFGKSPETALFAAELAIEAWDRLDVNQKARLVDVLSPPNEGELPFKFINKLDQNINARDIARKFVPQLRPELDMVMAHLVRDASLTFETTQYLAKMALVEWKNLSPEARANFIDAMRPPVSGELPLAFIRVFKRKVNISQVRKLAGTYVSLIRLRPELEGFEFTIVNARVKQLVAAWESLPVPIRKEFGVGEARGLMPDLFIELTRTALRIGISAREKLEPASEPWRYDPNADEVIYEGANLFLVMKMLVQENTDLKLYPALLGQRARTLVDDWNNLPENIKTAFVSHDHRNSNNGILIGIPVTFIRLWHRLNSGVGISDRPAIEPEDDPNKGGGGQPGPAAEGGGGSTVAGLAPTGETSGSQAMMQALLVRMLANQAYVSQMQQQAVVSGGAMCRQPQQQIFVPNYLFQGAFAVAPVAP